MSEAKTAEKKKAPVRHLTPTQKAEAIALWRSGSVTLDDLSRRFKKDRTTFQRLFREQGVEKGADKEATDKKIQAAVEQTLVDDASVLAKRIKDTKEDHFKYVSGISKLTWNIIVTAQQEKRLPGSYASDMKSLEMAMRVFKMTREEKYALLGINADDANEDKPLPDLVIQELTAQDIKDLQERSLMQDDELGLNDTLGDEEMIADAVEEDDDDSERVEVDD